MRNKKSVQQRPLVFLTMAFLTLPTMTWADGLPDFDPSEVYRSDSLYVPLGRGSSVETLQSFHRQNTGLILKSPIGAAVQLPERPAGINQLFGNSGSAGGGTRTSGPGGGSNPNGGGGGSGGGSSGDVAGGNGADDPSDSADNYNAETFQANAASVDGGGAINLQTGANGLTKVDGMVYSDDGSEGLDDLAAPGDPSSGPMAGQLYGQEAAVLANQGLDTGDDQDPAGSGSANPSGAFGVAGTGTNPLRQGGNPNISKAAVDPGADNLQAIADSLGKGSMGVNRIANGAGSRNRGRLGPDGKPLGPNARRKIVRGSDTDRFRNLLKDRYGRYISSQKIEFGAASSHMFKGMCSHYANYAVKNRIPTYKHLGCGKK